MEQALEQMRKLQAEEALLELDRKGVKKIGKIKLFDIADDPVAHYDKLMEARRDLARREKDIDAIKIRKQKQCELWARAIKEEEKIVNEKYCKANAESEMEKI